jgi:hypothetical protein
VDAVMAVVLVLVSLAFSSGINIFAIAFVLVVVNITSVVAVARQA